jgi:glycosyl transferase family 1
MAQVVAPVQAHVIPNGVDLAAFQPIEQGEARARLGWAADQHYVLFPGDPAEPRKGFALAQQAINAAARQCPTRVTVVPLRGIAPGQVPLYMNACDAMLLTSLIEGSPNVVKEAMACNLPVVAVPVGDVPELLAGVPGYTICPRHAQQLGDTLAHVLASPSQAAGRTALEQKGLDLASVARRVLAVYECVLEV